MSTPFEQHLLTMRAAPEFARRDVELLIALITGQLGTEAQRSAVIRILKQLRSENSSAAASKVMQDLERSAPGTATNLPQYNLEDLKQ